ncbi:MAG TPA: autotransporter outer membrane beta-barrel domain-containing protein [Geminicoccaceae bacterium]|nr:autotransporter outer membrane beta-barrel domain-containing protein [Geminicoccus sp.]HMU50103.1 autotransporter outer membrane beta-barrel domain-containing protein [Geminicoccaceae bacterium]
MSAPYVDLDAIYTRQPSYDESGAGDLNLDVRSSDQWSLVATPSVEVGGRVTVGETNTLRPYARVGLALSNQDDWTSKARLAAAPGGADGFESSVPMDEVTTKVGAGLQLDTQRGLELRLQYDGQFSSNLTSHGGSLRIALPF